MAEFGIMGVLTELAHNVGISIPAAGHMISYYALGVVVGAPIIALFSSRYSLKHILLFLVALCVIGNAMFTLSSSYLMLAIGRLVSGFRMAHFLASERSCYQNYQTRQSHRRRGRDGFRDDSRQFAGHSTGNVFKSGI